MPKTLNANGSHVLVCTAATLTAGSPVALVTSGSLNTGVVAFTMSGRYRIYEAVMSINVTTATTANTTVTFTMGAMTITATLGILAIGVYHMRCTGYAVTTTSIEWAWSDLPAGAVSGPGAAMTYTEGTQYTAAGNVTLGTTGVGTARYLDFRTA